jgi:hypothetical protein
MPDIRARVVALIHEVQDIPYAWPGEPTASAVRALGRGTCASKHALLTEELDSLGVRSVPLLVVGPLVPSALATEDDCREGVSILEVHECLTVLTPWAGPLLVDVTWDPALAAHGLASTRPWDGASDMRLAVDADGAGWAVDRSTLRACKESLRRRLYAEGERTVRDQVLAAISAHFARWRRVQGRGGEAAD